MFLKLPVSYDISGLKSFLLSDHGLWDLHDKRRTSEGGPHAQMTDIWVRFGDVSGGDYSVLGRDHDSVWYPCADQIPGIKDIALHLMSAVRGERLGGVLITKLPPKGRILPHTDSGWHAGYYDKFYIAISNLPGSSFSFENGIINANSGECFWFRNDVLHWVDNNSTEDRLAMIVCIKTDLFKVGK